MTRTEIIDRIVSMLEKIANEANLTRIYRFIKYIYLYKEAA